MSTFAHPSPERLLKWLEDKPSKLERYLAAHPEHAGVLDAELERLSQLPELAKSALAAAITAPVDLAERLRSRFGPPPLGTETSAVVMDLVGLGLAAFKELLETEPLDGTVPTRRTGDA